MKSTEMAQESNVISMRNERRSNRPSVAAKMHELANNSGDISYDSVLRIVGDEIDAEKKSKMLLRTSLLLLFSLLALTAANAGLTFAVVEFAKDTTVTDGVMTTKDGSAAIKVASTDFALVDGRMVSQGESPSPVATATAHTEWSHKELLRAAAMEPEALDHVEQIIYTQEQGNQRSFHVTGYNICDDFTCVEFETASGMTVRMHNQGDVEIEDTAEARQLRKKEINAISPAKFMAVSVKVAFHVKRSDGLYRDTIESVQLAPVANEATTAADNVATFFSQRSIVKDKYEDFAEDAPLAYDLEAQVDFDFEASNMQFHEGTATWTYEGSGYGSSSGRRHLQGFGNASGSTGRYVAPRGNYYSVRRPLPSWTYSLPIPAAYPCYNNDANGFYCEHVDACSFISQTELGNVADPNGYKFLTDMWGYSKAGRDFVIQATTNSVHFVEVTDPNNPILIGAHDLDGWDFISRSWNWSEWSFNYNMNIIADVKTIGDNIYIVSWRKNSSVKKMNGAQLLTAATGTNFVWPTHMIAYRACCWTGFSDRIYNRYLAAHNIVGFQDILLAFWQAPTWRGGNFSCYPGDAGVMILDAVTPSKHVGCISAASADPTASTGEVGAAPGGQGVGAPHDGACHDYGYKQVCFLAGSLSGKLSAVNVSPLIGRGAFTYTSTSYADFTLSVDHQVTIAGAALTHQVAVTAVGDFMIVTDEFDEKRQDSRAKSNYCKHPSNMFKTYCRRINMRLFAYSYSTSGGFNLVSAVDTGRMMVRDHQGYFYDQFYFLAAVKAGLIIYEVTDFTSGNFDLVERGWYDIYAERSLRQFGTWSVYVFPYTRCNGNTYYKTAVADMSGLHLVQPDFHSGSATFCGSISYPAGRTFSQFGAQMDQKYVSQTFIAKGGLSKARF